MTHCFAGFCEEYGLRPEFLTRFEDEGKAIASGRTHSPAETVEAIWHWIEGDPLYALYDRFSFVDWQKRELGRMRSRVLEEFSGLGSAQSELAYSGSAQSRLWFRSETRSAHIYFHGRNEFPEAACHWNQCKLFLFQAHDCSALGAVLKQWLCDDATPSTMRKEFPWLKIGELADYYENGKPAEGEFIQSWERMEQFYNCEYLPPKERTLVLRFIAELRRAGYDRKLRAGQSMWTFILSRSRRHRLRAEQPSIQFQFKFREGTMDVHSRNPDEGPICGIVTELSRRVEEALDRLVNQPIN